MKTSPTVKRNRPQSILGFTLIEVLIGLAVGGLILTMVASGLRFGDRLLKSRSHQDAAISDINAVERTLRHLIEAALPGLPGAADMLFVGTPRGLSFRTVMPDGSGLSAQRTARVELRVDTGQRLTLVWSPWYRNWIVPPPPPSKVDLLERVDHLECAYWSPGLNIPPGQWLTAWSAVAPPRLVRLRLIFASGSGTRWPEIIVATARDARIN